MRDVPRPAATFDRPKLPAARSNDVYADKSGEVYRRTKEGQWQQREGDRWKTGGAVSTAKPRVQTGETGRPPAGKPPVVTAKPVTGVTRSAPRPDLERDFSARQRGDARMRDRNTASLQKEKVTRPSPGVRPEAGSHGKGGDKDKKH
jgi:hypothetical protein